MAYLLELHDTAVAPDLFNLDLSREGRLVLARLLNDVRVYADMYIQEPERRLFSGSDCFNVDVVFRDPVTRVIYQLRFIISDAAAQYGVLRVVYVEAEIASPGL